ncbi:MAG: protein translocase SEC61 complex subunit gamma [Candidatus Odinarchaeia archaeon]
MNISNFIQQAKRVFHVAKRPTRKEIRYGVRMNLIAILILGILSFIIRIIFFAVLGL